MIVWLFDNYWHVFLACEGFIYRRGGALSALCKMICDIFMT